MPQIEPSANKKLKEGQVAVIGAGFSGLVSAFYLQRAGFTVEVFEKSQTVGGLLATVQLPEGPVETGANALLNSYLVEELFSELGIELIFPEKTAKRRYIFRWQKPRRWPLSVKGGLRLLRFLIGYLLSKSGFGSILKQRYRPYPKETVKAWGDRVLGSEITDYLVSPALHGVYAANLEKLSAQLIVGRFFGIKNEAFVFHCSPAGAGRTPRRMGSVSAPDGMGQLMHTLFTYLKNRGVVFHFGFENGLSLNPTQTLVIATPAFEASALLKNKNPGWSARLGQIAYLPLMSVTVFYSARAPTGARLKGFGCLFPSREKRKALGVLFNSSIFANRVSRDGELSETWMIGPGDASAKNPLELTDSEILHLIETEREQVFGWRDQRVNYRITRWPRALPHYTLELEELTNPLLLMENQVVLMGNYLGGIGLAKILERAEALPRYLIKRREK